MPKRPLAAVILAAGEGKRFRSATPKVLHPLLGRPLLAGVLDAVTPLKPAPVVLVVGRAAEQVKEAATAISRLPLVAALQERQLGTGDAARVADDALGKFAGDVLVLAGDTPLLTATTLKALVGHHRRARSAVTILSATLDDPTGYGRIVRDGGGSVARIVEQADADADERAIREVNTGVYVFDRALLSSALGKVERSNAQAEYYLTDVIAILREKGERVSALAVAAADEVMGVNSRAQLADAAAVLRARINREHMDAGVTIVDPSQTYIEPGIRIGADTVIHPQTFLSGDTRIGAGCEIGPSAQIDGSRIDDGARVRFAVVDGARVGPDASVGPFAYLRPGARLERGAKVGTYVEVKKSTIGRGSKVPHLSYVGDATIGAGVNVGAGTITVNYDPETRVKAATVIGDDAKIGSDTMLIAPVRIGAGAITAAGSVVTRDVPRETVVAGVPAKPMRARKREDAAPKGPSGGKSKRAPTKRARGGTVQGKGAAGAGKPRGRQGQQRRGSA